jgi:hypothetical protein
MGFSCAGEEMQKCFPLYILIDLIFQGKDTGSLLGI